MLTNEVIFSTGSFKLWALQTKKIDLVLGCKKLSRKMGKISYFRSKQYSWDLFTKEVLDLSRKILLKK
jgi:hypothetical protein